MTIKGFKGDSWIRVLILGQLIDIVSAYKQNLSRRIAMDFKGRRIIVCDAGTEVSIIIYIKLSACMWAVVPKEIVPLSEHFFGMIVVFLVHQVWICRL